MPLSMTPGGEQAQEGGRRLHSPEVPAGSPTVPEGWLRFNWMDIQTLEGWFEVTTAWAAGRLWWPKVPNSTGKVVSGPCAPAQHLLQEGSARAHESLFPGLEMPLGAGVHVGMLRQRLQGCQVLGLTWDPDTPQSHSLSCHRKRRSCCEEGPSETEPSQFPVPRSLQPLRTLGPSRRSST